MVICERSSPAADMMRTIRQLEDPSGIADQHPRPEGPLPEDTTGDGTIHGSVPFHA